MRNRNRFDAEENQNLVKCWNVGNKVGVDCRDSRYKFSVSKANAADTYNAKTRT